MRRRWDRFREEMQSRLWPLPVAAIVVAVGLGVGVPALDRLLDEVLAGPIDGALFSGQPDSARAMLSAISGSIITVTSLVFSLTVVALQLASSQASPRLLRMFTSDRRVHVTLAIFLGTFAYSMTVLPSVRSPNPSVDGDSGFVPRLAVSLTFLLMLVAVVALTLFLAHLAARLRVETMLRDVHEETSHTIRVLFSQEKPDDGSTAVPARTQVRLTPGRRSGFLVGVERDDLLALATREDLVISVDTPVGATVMSGTPLASWWLRDPLQGAGLDDERIERIDAGIERAHVVEYERTPVQDVAFGLRQLVDVAVKALSPGINDPTTAVHALGHVAALLGDLVAQPIPSTTERDGDGVVRIVGRQLDLVAMLDLGLTQPRHYGAADLFVALRLLALLQEVGWRTVHDELRPVIQEHADAVLAAAERTERPDADSRRLRAAHAAVAAALRGEWTFDDRRPEPSPGRGRRG